MRAHVMTAIRSGLGSPKPDSVRSSAACGSCASSLKRALDCPNRHCSTCHCTTRHGMAHHRTTRLTRVIASLLGLRPPPPPVCYLRVTNNTTFCLSTGHRRINLNESSNTHAPKHPHWCFGDKHMPLMQVSASSMDQRCHCCHCFEERNPLHVTSSRMLARLDPLRFIRANLLFRLFDRQLSRSLCLVFQLLSRLIDGLKDVAGDVNAMGLHEALRTVQRILPFSFLGIEA